MEAFDGDVNATVDAGTLGDDVADALLVDGAPGEDVGPDVADSGAV